MHGDDLATIRRHVATLLAERDDHAPFTDGEPLIKAGRLDSLAIVHLVNFLESAFAVDFGRIEFDPQRLGSVEGIAGVVAEWRSRA